MTSIAIRKADISELPALITLSIAAYGANSAMAQALFPDEVSRAVEWPALRTSSAQAVFADSGRHHIVATQPRDDGAGEEILGYAEWIAPGGPDPDSTEEQKRLKREERRRLNPPSMNRDAMPGFSKTMGGMRKAGLASIGLPEDADDDMWDLNNLAVDVRHQRKGVGRLLVQWGLDRAAADAKDTIITADPTGVPLYQNMGFEQIGQAEIFPGKPYAEIERVFIMRHRS